VNHVNDLGGLSSSRNKETPQRKGNQVVVHLLKQYHQDHMIGLPSFLLFFHRSGFFAVVLFARRWKSHTGKLEGGFFRAFNIAENHWHLLVASPVQRKFLAMMQKVHL